MEVCHIWTSTELNDYLDFPYVGQVLVIQRDTNYLPSGEFRSETTYGLTSLSREKASGAHLLTLNRRHSAIENGLHWVRDWAFDEDRCRIRRGAGARVMASLRNLVISLLRLAGALHFAAALRFCAHRQLRPLRLIGVASV